MINNGITGSQWNPKRPQIGKIVLPEQDSPFKHVPGTEIYLPEPKGPIIEVPYEFPNHFPDWSKMPKELPTGVPDQDEFQFPSGPTVPDWSKGPLELPGTSPDHFPGPAQLPGPSHLPGPGPTELPTFPGQTPGEVWLFNS